jgi:hypothetical protein
MPIMIIMTVVPILAPMRVGALQTETLAARLRTDAAYRTSNGVATGYQKRTMGGSFALYVLSSTVFRALMDASFRACTLAWV